MSENQQMNLNDIVSKQVQARTQELQGQTAQPEPQAQQANISNPHIPPMANYQERINQQVTQEPAVPKKRIIADDLVSEEELRSMETLPDAEEQAVIDHNNGSTLPPGVEEHLLKYEETMAEDYSDSYNIRKKLKEAGVQNGLVENTDPTKEKYAPEEDKEKVEVAKEETDEEDEDELSDEERKRIFNDKYEASTVVIKKFGDGYLDFTPDEQEKVSTAKVIKIEEVETVSLDSIRRKKKKRQKIDTVIKRRSDVKTIPVALPASGFVVALTGLSTHEVMLLVEQGDGQDPVAETQLKWSIIYDHIAETSIGKLSFQDFMSRIAYYDYSMLVFGLLCATYPADDKVGLQCNSCGKEYEHKYTMRSLIRTEKIPEELQERIMEIIEASHTEEAARSIANTSFVQETQAFRLPVSQYIFELHLQSANDFINQTVSGITELDDARYQQAAMLSTTVKTVLIPDPDTEDEYIEYEDFESIVKAIYSLHDKDLIILSDRATHVLENKDVKFGFMNVECPHCHHYSETLEVPIDQILFQRYQAAMTTKVE